MEKIQKKFAKDKVKMNEELQKLYQEEQYNPLAGCLPMLIQLPIIYGLYNVVYNPLTYIMWFSQNTIDKMKGILMPFIRHDFGSKILSTDPKIQIYLAKEMGRHMDKLGFLGHVKAIDFNFLGLDLSEIPKFALTVLVLIPVLCYITQALSTWLSFKMTSQIQQGQMGSGANMVMMAFLMPLMSVWFSTLWPAAIGFYWIVSNVFIILQVVLLNKYFSLEKLAKQSEERAEERRRAIKNGTAKPTRMQRITQQAIELQKQRSGEAQSDQLNNNEKQEKPVEETVKVNTKGKKSRSQIKEEQRRRLAKSRQHEGS
jgi:YidC/Oxa1 family membrane protein insertase